MNSQPYGNNYKVQNSINNCTNLIPPTTYQCYLGTYRPCPAWNGSYAQCTNNFQHKVNIARCRERSYEYSPFDERLCESCVYNNYNPFEIKNMGMNPYAPSIFPRVNMWRNSNIVDNFFIQTN